MNTIHRHLCLIPWRPRKVTVIGTLHPRLTMVTPKSCIATLTSCPCISIYRHVIHIQPFRSSHPCFIEPVYYVQESVFSSLTIYTDDPVGGCWGTMTSLPLQIGAGKATPATSFYKTCCRCHGRRTQALPSVHPHSHQRPHPRSMVIPVKYSRCGSFAASVGHPTPGQGWSFFGPSLIQLVLKSG